MMSFISRLLAPVEAEPDDQPFTPDEVAALRAAVPLDAGGVLDDATWRDLLLPQYTDVLAARRARVQALLDDPAQLDEARGLSVALPVVASMQNEDSLFGGQSLYVAELTRARAVLERARGDRPVVCLLDEIFRGTNHEESVSAAVAVVDELARHALVVVSSHNLVLGTLLAPWRIVRGDEGGLVLEPGVLERTNGVALLAEHGFDEAVQCRAEQVAAWLAQQRIVTPA